MIGILVLGSLVAALSVPGSRVRDAATASPHSGAVAESDSSLHAASRTPSASPPPRVVRLPGLEVTRSRLDRARERAPTAFVTDLALRPATHAVLSLTDALAAAAGVDVVQYGGLGAFSTVSLRGAPPGEVTLYLDGAPLTAAAHGVVSLSELPASAIERVEIYRGAPPLDLGPPAPGGAVNFVTGESDARLAHVAWGAYGTGEARGTFAARRGPWALLAHAGWQGSRGDFRYWSDNGTPFTSADDGWRTRANDRFDATSALARLGFSPRRELRAGLRVEQFHKAQGVPGSGSLPPDDARLAFDRVLVAGDAAYAPGDRLPRATLRADLQRARSRFRDSGLLGFGRQDTDEHFGDEGVTLAATSPAAWRYAGATLGGALRRDTARPAPPTEGQAIPPQSRRDAGAAFASLDLRPWPGRVLLHAGRRWDRQVEHLRYTATGGFPARLDAARVLDAPQLGARVVFGRGVEARANWFRSGRAPAFLELFGNQGSVLGSPTLRPERGEGWDAGGGWSGARGPWRAALEWAHHQTHVRDLIEFARANASATRAANAAGAELRGEELSLRLAGAHLELSGSHAWLSALDTESPSIYHGRRLPQRPSRRDDARLALFAGAWRAAADVQRLGDEFLDPINFYPVPARTLVGASLARTFGPLTVTLEGRNLGDERASDVAGFPLPGRMLFASLEAGLGRGDDDHP